MTDQRKRLSMRRAARNPQARTSSGSLGRTLTMPLEPFSPPWFADLRETEEAPALEPEQGLRLENAFARGSGRGLLWLLADG